MRKTASTYKNFLTGEVVEKEKLKSGNLKGKFTIQTFDADGKVTQEVETENVVSSSFEQRLLQDMFKNIGSAHYDLNHGYNSHHNYRGHISGILLTTARNEEDASNLYIEGDEISYKNITAVNNLECSSKFQDNGDLKITYIMDYLTTESNGTFQSIYLTQGFRHSTPSGWSSVKRCGDIYPYFSNFCFDTPFVDRLSGSNSSYESNNYLRFYVQNNRFDSEGLDMRNISFTRGGTPLVCRWDIDAKVWRYYEFMTGEDHFWLTGSLKTIYSDFTYKTPFEDAAGNYYHFHWTYPYTLDWRNVIATADRKLSCRIEKINSAGTKIKDIILDFAPLIPEQDLSAISGIAPFMTHDGKVLFQLSFRGTRTDTTSYSDRYWQYKQRMFNLVSETFEESWVTTGDLSYNSYDRGIMDCETNNYPCLRDQKLRRHFRQLIDKRLPYKTLDSELPHIIWGTGMTVYDPSAGDARPSTRLVSRDHRSIQSHIYFNSYAHQGYTKKIMGYSKKYDGWFVHSDTIAQGVEYHTRGIVFPIHQWFAHTCLPSPVTKSDLETMKIRYEITVPFSNLPKFTGNGGLSDWVPNMSKLRDGVK